MWSVNSQIRRIEPGAGLGIKGDATFLRMPRRKELLTCRHTHHPAESKGTGGKCAHLAWQVEKSSSEETGRVAGSDPGSRNRGWERWKPWTGSSQLSKAKRPSSQPLHSTWHRGQSVCRWPKAESLCQGRQKSGLSFPGFLSGSVKILMKSRKISFGLRIWSDRPKGPNLAVTSCLRRTS